jgi:LuxR family maltose regulon positive regulatory protein
VGQLPNDLSQDYPMLCIWQAWAFLLSGQLEAVEPVLEIAEANRDKVSGIPILGYTTTVRAYLVNQMGDLHKAIDLSKQALVEMSVVSPDRNTLIHRGAAIIWLGVNHRFLGDLGKARDFFAEAVLLNQEAGNIYGALSAIAQLADLAVICGHLHQAVETYQRGLQIAQRWKDEREKGRSPLVAESELHLGLGTVQYIMNDLTIAEPHIQQAIQLHELGETSGSMHSKKMLAYLKQAEGDYETAYDLVDKACMIRDSINIHHYNLSVEPGLEQLRILLSRTRPDMAHLLTDLAQWFEAMGLRPDDKVDFSSPDDYPRESEYSDLARALIPLYRTAEALPLLKRLLEAARSMGRQGDEIRYLILIALAHHALEDMASALDALSQALTLAKPQGYVRIFVDEGNSMAELLVLAISQDITPDYASELLAVFPEDVRGTVDVDIKLKNNTQPLVDPLSERELEVLRLMAEGFKYQEIADRLIISINTVRHHNRNIFSKLNVNSRVQAIDRARELHLL